MQIACKKTDEPWLKAKFDLKNKKKREKTTNGVFEKGSNCNM